MTAFPPALFDGRKFAIVGLGLNGRPAAEALRAMGAEVTAWDDSEAARAAASGLMLRDLREGGLNFDAIVLSPGIPHILPQPHPIAARAAAAGIPIVSDVELLYQAVRRAGSRARFVGITGTNGKSTTTALLAHVLGQAGWTVAAGGNLGPAALSLPLLPDDGTYVLEMSSYMLERLATVRFDAAAMLNLSVDHIDRHGDMAGYALAKQAVFDRQTRRDLAVIGVEDAGSQRMANWLDARPARVIRVSGSGAANGVAATPADVFCRDGVLRDAYGPILRMADAIALPGAHNAQNAAAAAALAAYLGLDRDRIASGIASYPGLPHRQQRIVTIDGVTFVNDSKATNADAAERALICYDRLIWIAGGMGKEGGIVPLAAHFPRIARAMLIGRDAPVFAATLSEHGVPFDMAGTLDAAVPAAFAAAKREHAPVVLLSPATASWDQFKSYEHRGERFSELARGLMVAVGEGGATPATRRAGAVSIEHHGAGAPERYDPAASDRHDAAAPDRHGLGEAFHQHQHDVASDGPVEPGHDETRGAGPDDTRGAGPDDTRGAGPDDTRGAGPDDTRGEGPDDTRGEGPDDGPRAGRDGEAGGGGDDRKPGAGRSTP